MSIYLLTITSTLVLGQEIHSHHCLYGCPLGAPATNDLIIREIYILSSNDLTKFADWVAYKVTKETIGPTKRRSWKTDPLLEDSETLEPNDYKGANAALKTDRGHQVPLASFTGTQFWKTTNYLSNITPQKSALNQGPWLRLESAVRSLVKQPEIKAVYVMTGPLYEQSMELLPQADEAHFIPSAYWKVLAIDGEKGIEVTGFIFKQDTPRSADYCNFQTTIDAVEKRSGLDLFHKHDSTSYAKIENASEVLIERLGCSHSN